MGKIMANINASNNGRLKILVVDDDPSIVDIVTTCLDTEGYDVSSAVNGSAA
ncbi:MAG TPA: DNA-binding response regulator, partial [Candidatus Latescibacteria bacterium]|nr:DNA-binding response regulator [Candidatus Latescibacterota bacterium]